MTRLSQKFGVDLAVDLSTDLASPPNQEALAALVAAPSADVFFDGEYGYALDSLNKVSLLASRVGDQVDATIHTVEQSSGPLQPVWGMQSPTGRRGIKFTRSLSHRLIDPLTTLAGLYDGTQAYSALWVVRTNTAINQCVFSFGDSGNSANVFWEGNLAVGHHIAFRSITGGANTQNNGAGTATMSSAIPSVVTTVFTGSAYNSWINGTEELSNAANTRSVVADQLAIGMRRQSGAFAVGFDGIFFGLILSRAQWTTGERQALEAAARLYWGTV